METAAIQALHPVLNNSQKSSSEVAISSNVFVPSTVKSMEELVHSQAPTLRAADRKEIIIKLIASIGDYLNFIGASMKDEVIAEVASMMIDNHPHLPTDALRTFFYECKRGSYGYHYNKMDGAKLLMWFDKFVEEYYRQVDNYEYAKHESTKGDLANPANLTDEEGEPIDLTEVLASFHGKSKEQLERENRVKDIRYKVFKEHMHLYDTMSIEAADRVIENAIIEEMKAQGLLTF